MSSQMPDSPVVGIGPSSGGVTALQNFFDYLPGDGDKVFTVVIHLDPDHSSSLSETLETHTGMKVPQVIDKTEVKPDRISNFAG